MNHHNALAQALLSIAFWIAVSAPVSPAAAASTPAAKSASRAAPVKVVSLEGITEYRLANGLRVLLFPDPSKPTLTVNVTYLVGSRYEGYGETGMAHLLEHLLFKGTPRNPDIGRQFNQRGARWNGTTSFDRTNYFEIVPASLDNLTWAIELEADRMVNSNIAARDLASEMTVVRNEYELGENNPYNVLWKRLRSVAFDWHNYQNHPIGNRSDIEQVKIENLQAFYRRYYQPDNAVVLVAGQFDPATALKLIARSFGKIPKPTRVLTSPWTVEPMQDGERIFTVRRAGKTQLVVLAYKIPSALHPDRTALAYAAAVLGYTPSGRLYQQLVETGKAVSVSAYADYTLDPGLLTITATVKEGEPLDDVQALLIEAVENFHRSSPTDVELERVHRSDDKNFEQTLNAPESLAIALSETIAAGDWRLWFYEHERGQTIRPADVARVAQAYLRRDNRTLGRFIPTDEPQRVPMPAAPSAAELLKDFQRQQTTAAGEVFDPAPANINARTHRYTLANGMQVALLPKQTRGQVVQLVLQSHYGDLQSHFGKGMLVNVAGYMLSRGTSRYTRTQFADEFERLKLSGNISLGNARLQTTRPNLVAALELAAHVMREPTFPPAELEQLRKEWISSFESDMGEPSVVSSDALGKHFNTYERGDPRYPVSRAEAIEDLRAMTVDKLRQVHRDFTGFSNAEIAIVGDFDEAEVRAALERLFARWTSPLPYTRIEEPYQNIAPLNRTLVTPDKENAVFRAQLLIEMRDDDPDFPALTLVNYMLGGGAGFNSRITQRIRVREGLSYGAYTWFNVSSFDRRGTFGAYASVAPANIAKLEAIFREELIRARRDGFTAEELTNAKSGLLSSRRQDRAQDSHIADYWTQRLFQNETYLKAAQMDAKFQAVTLSQVNAALRNYIDPDKLAIIKAGDFANIKANAVGQ